MSTVADTSTATHLWPTAAYTSQLYHNLDSDQQRMNCYAVVKCEMLPEVVLATIHNIMI